MRILVAGLPKSGTTALYYCLKQSLPGYYKGYFEPRHKVSAWRPFVLAKILLREGLGLENLTEYNRRILIIRDPRDNLVSRLLYSLFHLGFLNDPTAFNIFMARLSRKRDAPHSVSLLELYRLALQLGGRTEKSAQIAAQSSCLPDVSGQTSLIYKYEDFVVGRYADLESYLSVKVHFDGQVASKYGRVARTKSSGDWKNWFTDEDVEHLLPLYADSLARYGYDTDWSLNPTPQISAEHSTEYVLRLARERAGNGHLLSWIDHVH